MTWTDERVAVLRKMRAEGGSAGQIAREMGLTRNAVIGKLWRMRKAEDAA